jgi:competence protein ComEA
MMILLRTKVLIVILGIVLVAGGSAVVASAEGVVNINTADAQSLMLLPRVGPAIAERIIEFRENNGKFKSVEDLMLVRGVGEKTFELLEPYLAISGETTLVEKVKPPKSS